MRLDVHVDVTQTIDRCRILFLELSQMLPRTGLYACGSYPEVRQMHERDHIYYYQQCWFDTVV